MRKIAVCTTFPNSMFDLCAAEMLESFHKNWPEDIKLYIQLDPQSEESFTELNNKIIDIVGEDRAFIAALWDDEQINFVERWKNHKPKTYMDDVVKFSHKVFALEKCADAIKDDIDVLIWLDADGITKQPVTHEWLETVLPDENQVCSYLGRDGWYSECGWVAYNLKYGGYDLLKSMKDMYTSDEFKNIKNGWTDCHVFDFQRNGLSSKNLSPFYIKDKTDINVWKDSKLSEKMVHRKGRRKEMARQVNQNNIVDSNDIKIKTKNCLDHEKICSNVKENISQIRAWATLCARSENDIIIASAGPSLVDHIDEIKTRVANGAKLIAVKHAINTLKENGIKPWGVVLLDPRAHVEGFVNDPDKDVVYFVSSMCDPSVIRTLNKHRCNVIGYHALVGAGETGVMISSDLPVSGGSATATRAIGLFSDMFGFKNFHLYGYDLCYLQKPDLSEKNEDGQLKYMEISLGTYGHNNKYVTRTFWTEGQFLAQSNELANLYKTRNDINMIVYGDGMAGWLYKNHVAYTKFRKEYNEKLERHRIGTPTLESFVNGVTRGCALSRGE